MLITHTISLTELVWTVVCLVALWYFLKLFRRAMTDLRWVQSEGLNGARRDAARIPIVIFGMLLGVEVGYVILGLVALTLPPLSPGQQRPSTFGYVASVVFILSTVSLTIGAYWVENLRGVVIRRVMARMVQESEMAD